MLLLPILDRESFRGGGGRAPPQPYVADLLTFKLDAG